MTAYLSVKCIVCDRDGPYTDGRIGGDGNWICGRARCRIGSFLLTFRPSRRP